jgi:hypothetical protein
MIHQKGQSQKTLLSQEHAGVLELAEEELVNVTGGKEPSQPSTPNVGGSSRVPVAEETNIPVVQPVHVPAAQEFHGTVAPGTNIPVVQPVHIPAAEETHIPVARPVPPRLP